MAGLTIYCPSCGQLNTDFVGQAQLKGQDKAQGKLF